MSKSLLGRMMLSAGLTILVTLFAMQAFAQDISVVEVRRNIPLSDEAPVYKDFYINAGMGAGLKKNMVVTLFRRIVVRDATGTQTFGEISIPVGQLKVIAAFDKVAVAREYKLISRDEEAMLEQIGIMTGDRVDLASSFIDNKKTSSK